MSRQSGALRIFLYNWPVYVATWTAAVVVLVSATRLPKTALVLVTALACGAVVWSVASLAVSFYIYDRSVLVSGAWVPGVLGKQRSTWATIHAGLDAEVELDAVMPGECLARLDVFDPRVMTSPSIVRARARTPRAKAATRCSPTALALNDASCDAVVVAFTVHEIRDPTARDEFFGEIRRALRPGGRAIVVEHFRDLPNFLAFGLGFVHFVPRGEWLSCAERARLAIALETKVTPWVTALVLERPA
jgi:SAM-dependent methyltransferase